MALVVFIPFWLIWIDRLFSNKAGYTGFIHDLALFFYIVTLVMFTLKVFLYYKGIWVDIKKGKKLSGEFEPIRAKNFNEFQAIGIDAVVLYALPLLII